MRLFVDVSTFESLADWLREHGLGLEVGYAPLRGAGAYSLRTEPPLHAAWYARLTRADRAILSVTGDDLLSTIKAVIAAWEATK